jgi:hypothetical protein
MVWPAPWVHVLLLPRDTSPFSLFFYDRTMEKHAQVSSSTPGMPFLALEEEAHRQRGLDTRPSCAIPTTLGVAVVLQRRQTMETI